MGTLRNHSCDGPYLCSHPPKFHCCCPSTEMLLPKSQLASLVARQANGSTSSSCNCISGGAIAGIVIGSIAGTLLILWMIYTVRAVSDTPREEHTSSRSGRSHRGSRRGSHTTYIDRTGRANRVREPS